MIAAWTLSSLAWPVPAVQPQYALLDPPPPYAVSGAFALNIWLKTRTSSDLKGTGFAYIFSHTARGAVLNSRGIGPDQVCALQSIGAPKGRVRPVPAIHRGQLN